ERRGEKRKREEEEGRKERGEREEERRRGAGERPMTPTAKPSIAASRRIKRLYINAGHGRLGWTLAGGSARRVVDLFE
ncbi:FAD-dependent oxidoreductase, partial [Rhizobium ruizarguesonis]